MRELNINGEPKVEATLPELFGEPDATKMACVVASNMPRNLKELLLTAFALKHMDVLETMHIDPFSVAANLLDRWEHEKQGWKQN